MCQISQDPKKIEAQGVYRKKSWNRVVCIKNQDR